MQKIQDKDRLYNCLHPYVNWMFKHAYRHIKFVGRENIPTDGSVIFAPNHTNALQDALAILAIDNKPKVFVARADIFRHPTIRKILTFFKIMPINRMRDGVDSVRHNDATETAAIEALHDKVHFCILPEGTHQAKHSLLPLKKGIFRIALRANDAFGHEQPIYIVPVGIEYADFFHLWDSLIVNIGKPINVTEIAAKHADLERPELILHLLEELTHRMQELILWVPNDKDYEQNIHELQANPPAPLNAFAKHKMSKYLLGAMLLVLLPLFLFSAVITFPLWSVWLLIRKVIKDKAFHNSVQFVWQLVFVTLTLWTTLPFWMFFQEYLYLFRKLIKIVQPSNN